jgi:hypothetical protein
LLDKVGALFEGLKSVDEFQQFVEVDPIAHQSSKSIGAESIAVAAPACCFE